MLIITNDLTLCFWMLACETQDVVAKVPALKVVQPPVDDAVIATTLHSSK
jgi:hypothetical protein